MRIACERLFCATGSGFRVLATSKNLNSNTLRPKTYTPPNHDGVKAITWLAIMLSLRGPSHFSRSNYGKFADPCSRIAVESLTHHTWQSLHEGGQHVAVHSDFSVWSTSWLKPVELRRQFDRVATCFELFPNRPMLCAVVHRLEQQQHSLTIYIYTSIYIYVHTHVHHIMFLPVLIYSVILNYVILWFNMPFHVLKYHARLGVLSEILRK